MSRLITGGVITGQLHLGNRLGTAIHIFDDAFASTNEEATLCDAHRLFCPCHRPKLKGMVTT